MFFPQGAIKKGFIATEWFFCCIFSGTSRYVQQYLQVFAVQNRTDGIGCRSQFVGRLLYCKPEIRFHRHNVLYQEYSLDVFLFSSHELLFDSQIDSR